MLEGGQMIELISWDGSYMEESQHGEVDLISKRKFFDSILDLPIITLVLDYLNVVYTDSLSRFLRWSCVLRFVGAREAHLRVYVGGGRDALVRLVGVDIGGNFGLDTFVGAFDVGLAF